MASNVRDLVSKLTPIEKGMLLEDVVTSERMQAMQDLLLALTRGDNLMKGHNIRKRSGPDWVMLSAGAQAGPESLNRGHPFQVTESTEGGPSLTPKVVVEKDSWIMKSEKWDDKLTISGLGEPFALAATDNAIWIELTIAGGVATSATIKHGQAGTGDIWKKFPEPFGYPEASTDPVAPAPNQEKYYQLLAYIEDKPKEDSYRPGVDLAFTPTTRQLVQCTYTNLIICEKCYAKDGQLVKVLAPWHAPYVPNLK